MPIATTILRPGVNTQRTLAGNEAGVSVSNLIRYKDQIIQKTGGWDQFFSGTYGSTIRAIHGWQGLTGIGYLAVATTGSTGALNVITTGSNQDITPQTNTTNHVPSFSVAAGSNIVTVVDANSSASIYDTVYFNTPVAVAGLLFNGAYQVYAALGSSSYQILSSNNSTTTVSSVGTLPTFTTVANDATVTVTLPNNNFPAISGLYQQFIAPTTVTGLTIQGPYEVNSIIDSTTFKITAANQSTGAGTATMNGGNTQIVYYVALGPPPGAGGYGIGGYGLGGYGLGSPVPGGTGTPITATDWTMANWGEALLANPTGGPIYVWSPKRGFQTAQVISQAPFFNNMIFVSQPQQILVALGSVQTTGVQDPLEVKWSDSANYTNWTISNQTAAGAFRIPTGSKIMGGLQGPQQGFIWTDVDAWVMQYVGGTVIFNFTRIGSGCGLIGKHAAGVIAGTVYWCSNAFQFFRLGQNGVEPVPCTVWDSIFQNLSAANQGKIVCAPNSVFNEITWFFPSAASTGENDSYVKYNIVEGEWDYGTLPRNAWIDVTGQGSPIATDTMTVYQHEIGYDSVSQPINPVFESGYWAIAEGNELAFVDWILPDMKFGTYSGSKTASCQISFKVTDYAGDAPAVYGPYTFTQATEFISVRFRGRFMAIRIESSDTGSFWRIGAVKYRWARAGRR